MSEKSLELGELFKELRLARGLKLKDVARENLSVSQLSKFENGQTMLAADKLLIAIQGIHMTFSEFGYALTQYQESDLFKIGNQLVNFQAKRDVEGLRDLLKNY
ncbi:MAG: helix-turn-helix domain-containing protein, partial [Lactobacillus iners]|nr:helix-turn-helix domain-containing protein [Lactobacillus iners]MCT7707255.1 helix-turn-helix domain-containing protein [Lactobacillus iners]